MDNEGKIQEYLEKCYMKPSPELYQGAQIIDTFIKQTTQDETFDISYDNPNISSDGSIVIPVYAKSKSSISQASLNEENKEEIEQKVDSYRIGLITVNKKDIKTISYNQSSFSSDPEKGIQYKNEISASGRNFIGYIDEIQVSSSEKEASKLTLDQYFFTKVAESMQRNYEIREEGKRSY